MAKRNVKMNGQPDAGKSSARKQFRLAVESAEGLKNAFRMGKKALKDSEKGCVEAEDSKLLEGSVDIDGSVRNLYPDDNRWDYAVAYGGKVTFIEVHPGQTSEVNTVVAKLGWLKQWLRDKAPQLHAYPKAELPYVWIPSGKYNIAPGSAQERRLSQSGIKVRKLLRLK